MKSKRTEDVNGWITIPDNPISKVGIFDYAGWQIDSGLEPNRIFKIYRPAEELSKQSCIDSFKLVPLIDEHQMLGRGKQGAMSTDERPPDGVVGENVYFDEPYLKSTLKIWSDKRISALDSREKIELSMAYRCRYDMTPGIFQGQAYDGVQRDISGGNHVAFVTQGRSGPDVAVQDKFTLTFDAKDLAMQEENGRENEVKKEDEKDKEDEKLTVEDVMWVKNTRAKNNNPVVADQAISTADAALREQIAVQDARISNLETNRFSKDEAVRLVLDESAKRNELVKKLEPHIGTWNYAVDSLQQIAKRGIEALKVPCEAGQEVAALTAYLHNRVPPEAIYTIATADGGATESVSDILEQK